MRSKIMILALAVALLVGLVPPGSAMANLSNEQYDEGQWRTFVEQYGETLEPYIKENYVVVQVGSTYYLLKAGTTYGDLRLVIDSRGLMFYLRQDTYKLDSSVVCLSFDYTSGQWKNELRYDIYVGNASSYIVCSNIDSCYLTEVGNDNITCTTDFNVPYVSSIKAFEEVINFEYTFKKWCADAGLNCQASSNESTDFMPYSYNDYIHVVRRTGADKYGRWVLTTIGNSIIGDNLSDYTLMVDDAGELQVYALYSGEDEQGYQLFVRNYVYDTDGWKLISFELFDTREDDDFIIELGEDSFVNDANLLAYTSVDIYDDGLDLKHSASTEYYDVNDVLPDVPEQPEEPGVTPTVAPLPTVVPPITAGQATVTKNRTAIYEEPSSTSQVQHYLFEGGVVYVVEEYGEDWYYVRYDMGGLSYTGYIAQDNVNYDVENGYASEDVIDGYEGQVDDLLGMVGNVPKMIYALFSFLPPWCLALVGVSFSAMLALIGWKVLRG